MRLELIRHASTPGNVRRCYIGATDEALSPEGRAQAARLHCAPRERVYVTDLRRTAQTAAILFPEAEQIVLPALREMDFGAFEGKSAQDMEADVAYRAWVEGWCLEPCPGGESRSSFSGRVCRCFEEILRELLIQGQEEAVFLVHGGTVMAVLERFALPKGDYYSYSLEPCQAYICQASLLGGNPVLTDLRKGAPD